MRMKEALAGQAGVIATRHLQARGFRILDRNWRCGEEIVPVIAADRRTLVVVDLRVRAGTRHGAPLEALSAARRRAMRTLAARWLSGHGMRFDQVRIDVVGLLQDGTGGFTVEHVKAVG